MQALDAEALDTYGIPRLLLMDQAGFALARVVPVMLPRGSQPVMICAGTGFNGGDGLAAARHLHGLGYPLQVLLTGPVAHLSGEPAIFATLLQRLGIGITDVSAAHALDAAPSWFEACALIIDAILGIGLRDAVREPAAALIRLINASGKPVIAADVPSGLDADSGSVRGVAVRATTTVTFGLPKRGCFMNEGPAHTGTLLVDPIGFPPQLLAGA